MTFATRFNQLQNDIIAKLMAITDRPDGWLPHLVFVEEEGEDGAPVYNKYRLVDFKTDGSCTLRNAITNEDDRERHLSEINIDWFLRRYKTIIMKGSRVFYPILPEIRKRRLCNSIQGFLI